jgi:endo-1,4-beta-xylanase
LKSTRQTDFVSWTPLIGFVTTWLVAGCVAGPPGAGAQPALKTVFTNDFLVGAALKQSQFSGGGGCEVSLVNEQFNSISPENVLKWAAIHPEPNRYNFEPGDRYVEFGEQNHMFIVGHTLVWHNQTPRWVFEDARGNPVDSDTLLRRMRDHIFTVVGRYRGRIGGWDVVNEALNNDGSLRQSPWEKIIGEDYLLKAYEFAHEADPNAQLYYNDYGLENPPKRAGAIKLIKQLQSNGVPIAAVGLQSHDQLDRPTPPQLEETIRAFSKLGVKVNITELDVDVLPSAARAEAAAAGTNSALRTKLNPYPNGLPDSVQQALASRYASLFRVFVKEHEHIDRVTFWGVTDGDSWLNNRPVPGRRNYPLLFDRHCQPKPAFTTVIAVAPP